MFFDYLKIFFNKAKNDEFDEGSLFLNKERSELDSPRNLFLDSYQIYSLKYNRLCN